jgi:hypothetical protein
MTQPKKDIKRAQKDAIKIGFKMLWLDSDNKWRPCRDINSAPFFCKDVVEVKTLVSFKTELMRLERKWK